MAGRSDSFNSAEMESCLLKCSQHITTMASPLFQGLLNSPRKKVQRWKSMDLIRSTHYQLYISNIPRLHNNQAYLWLISGDPLHNSHQLGTFHSAESWGAGLRYQRNHFIPRRRPNQTTHNELRVIPDPCRKAHEISLHHKWKNRIIDGYRDIVK